MIAKRHQKPDTATSSTSISVSASAIPAATIVTTSTSLLDNTMIMTKIENATEGLQTYHDSIRYVRTRILIRLSNDSVITAK